MTHDDELIERVAKAIADTPPSDDLRDYAQCAITAVRAYDAERRASVPDIAAMVERFDPDDYRDLPLSMTADVRFRGGLTEGKP